LLACLPPLGEGDGEAVAERPRIRAAREVPSDAASHGRDAPAAGRLALIDEERLDLRAALRERRAHRRAVVDRDPRLEERPAERVLWRRPREAGRLAVHQRDL